MAKINNLAYDYTEYEVLPEENPKPIEHRRNLKLKPRVSTALRLIITGTVAGFMLFAMVFGKVELSKVYSEQSELQEQLSQLNEDNLSLKSELDAKTGLSQVEEYAENTLGLQKLDKSQVEYVEVETDDVIEAVDKDENIFVSIKKWFSDVLEYIGA